MDAKMLLDCFHTAGATGSIPVPPTIQKRRREQGSRKFPGSLLFSEWSLLRHFGTVLGQCQWRDRVKRHPGQLSYGDDRETRSILESEDPSRRPYGADQDFRQQD